MKLIGVVFYDLKKDELSVETQEAIIIATNEAFKNIPEVAGKILRRRFGIGCVKQTLASVALELGNLSSQRVRQIEASTLRKLRHPRNSPDLHDVLNKAELLNSHADVLNHVRSVEDARKKIRSGENLTEEDLGEIYVDFLDLDVRIWNAFKNERILTLLDLKKQTARTLRRIPNFGIKSLHLLEQEIAKFGVELKSE